MHLRAYQPSDAPALSRIFREAVLTLGARDYGPDQVAAWAARAPMPAAMHARCSDGRFVVVAADDADEPLAWGELEADGHIAMLYCAPGAAGQGVGARLVRALERQAARDGIGRLTVEASEAARRLFARLGYVEIARRDFTIGDGVPIHNYAMVKRLGLAGAPDT